MSTWHFVEGLRDGDLRGIGMFGRDHVLLKTYVCECTTYSRPSTSLTNYLNVPRICYGAALINNRPIERYIRNSLASNVRRFDSACMSYIVQVYIYTPIVIYLRAHGCFRALIYIWNCKFIVTELNYRLVLLRIVQRSVIGTFAIRSRNEWDV